MTSIILGIGLALPALSRLASVRTVSVVCVLRRLVSHGPAPITPGGEGDVSG